jgi:alpha-mannosidase
MKRSIRGLGILLCFGLAVSARGSAGPGTRPPEVATAHLVGHAHIDLSWLWRWEETVRDIAEATFRGTLDLMERSKGLTFAQSQAALYAAVEQTDPELFKAIRAKIKAGTWLPVGGMWVEPDLNLPDGESLVRQLLYGQRYFREKLGSRTRVGWNPDSFGHSAQLPQILKKAGIDYYVLERCAPDDTPFFWWQGLDGSRVLVCVPPGWYNLSLREGVGDVVGRAAEHTPVRDFLLLYGEGDHGGGPRATDLEGYRAHRREPGQPRMDFDSPERFFRKLSGLGVKFPVVAGELNFVFPGCYTSQARTKKNNRLAENLLLTAEKFSSAAVFGKFRDYYPERDLDEAWKLVLRNQFHDILAGSSIGPVYEEASAAYDEAFARARRALDFSLESIADDVDTRGQGWPIVVFNPLFWERTDAVEVELDLPADACGPGLVIQDPQGRSVPCQVLSRTEDGERVTFRLLFIAADVPSFGYRVFHALAVPADPEPESPLAVSETSLENEFFRVSLDPETGWMRSVLDKQTGREVLAAPGNVLEAIADEPQTMSAWRVNLKERLARIGETGCRLEVLERGPARVAVRIRGALRHSRFQQDIRLCRGVPRIDVRLTADWQERRVMIKAAFPAAARNREAFFEVPFGAVSRLTNGAEVPALRWIDLTDETGEFGLSLLNDCKYGFDVRDNVLRLSVIHGPTAPDPEADRGPQEMVYSLYPHSGSWREAGTVRRGYELNVPLEARPVLSHPGKRPPSASFISCEGDGVVVSALKKEYGYFNRGYILRAYETLGRESVLTLTTAWPVRAAEADLLDYSTQILPLQEGKVVLTFKPFEIKTIKIFHRPSDRS